ncbi:MAG: Rieske 2Fe-2S domain-containing protein [Acidobacteriota bacterium]
MENVNHKEHGECENCPNKARVENAGRRRFLNYLLGTSFGATVVAVFYPIIRFITPPQVIEAAQNSVVAGKITELAVNSGKIFKFGNKPGLLVRTSSGELKAFSATCTHLDCIVQYQPESKQIWCACHNGQYNLNGQNIGGPPPRPLEEYTVNTRGDEIIVSKG